MSDSWTASLRTWLFGKNKAKQLKSQVRDKFQTLISRLNSKLVKPLSIHRQIIDNNIYIENEEIKSLANKIYIHQVADVYKEFFLNKEPFIDFLDFITNLEQTYAKHISAYLYIEQLYLA